MATAGPCMGARCPHVAKVNITVVLDRPLHLKLPWVVVFRRAHAENGQKRCASGPGAACWHAPCQLTVLPMGDVDLS